MVHLTFLGVAPLLLLSGSTHAFVVSSTAAAAAAATRTGSSHKCAASQQTEVASPTMPEGSRLEFLRSSVGLVAAAAAGATLMPQAGNAEVFTDDVLGFKFETPDGWEKSDAQISGRRKIIVFTTAKNPGANAFVAYTPVRGDFTTLGSFGSLGEVSKTVLPEAEGVKSRLVDSYTSQNSYVYDYIVQQEGRPEKHIKTIWVLFPAEGQLATVTAQCDEADYEKLAKNINGIIGSVSKT